MGLRFPSVSITWNCKLPCYTPSGMGLRLPSVSTTWNCTLLVLWVQVGARGPIPFLPRVAGSSAGVCVSNCWGRPFLPLTGTGIHPVASNEAVEIANISTTPERRAEDLRARKARLKRPFVNRDKERKVLPSWTACNARYNSSYLSKLAVFRACLNGLWSEESKVLECPAQPCLILGPYSARLL